MSLQGMQQEETLNVLSLEGISSSFHELHCISTLITIVNLLMYYID